MEFLRGKNIELYCHQTISKFSALSLPNLSSSVRSWGIRTKHHNIIKKQLDVISADSPLYQRRLLSVSIVFAQDHVEQVGMDNGRQEMLSYCDRTRQRRDHTWLFTVLNLAFDYVTLHCCTSVTLCHWNQIKTRLQNQKITEQQEKLTRATLYTTLFKTRLYLTEINFSVRIVTCKIYILNCQTETCKSVVCIYQCYPQ